MELRNLETKNCNRIKKINPSYIGIKDIFKYYSKIVHICRACAHRMIKLSIVHI